VKRLPLLLTLLSGLFAVAWFARLAGEEPSSANQAEIVMACRGMSPCLEQSLTGLAVEDAGSLITALLEASQESGTCHLLMHAIGAELSGRVLTPEKNLTFEGNALLPYFGECNMGLMHGFIENMDFRDTSRPGREAFRVCREWASSSKDMEISCQHALGHSFYTTLVEGASPRSAEIACLEGPSVQAQRACLSGVYMLRRDTLLTYRDSSMPEVLGGVRGCTRSRYVSRDAISTGSDAMGGREHRGRGPPRALQGFE